jgi:hypothetical protein
MAIVNQAEKKIILKIVFYGPGLSGKSTVVKHLSEKYEGTNLKGEKDIGSDLEHQIDDSILETAEKSDDYLVKLGNLRGFNVQVNLISVPGMVYHNAARQLLLRDVDGIMFVADSQQNRLDANKFSYLQMRDNLYEELRGNVGGFPVVLLYNKRDLPNAAPVEAMDKKLNPNQQYPTFETIATTGEGVSEAFKKVCGLAFKRL